MNTALRIQHEPFSFITDDVITRRRFFYLIKMAYQNVFLQFAEPDIDMLIHEFLDEHFETIITLRAYYKRDIIGEEQPLHTLIEQALEQKDIYYPEEYFEHERKKLTLYKIFMQSEFDAYEYKDYFYQRFEVFLDSIICDVAIAVQMMRLHIEKTNETVYIPKGEVW